MLSENIVPIIETVKGLTQPDVLSAMNNAVTVFKSMDVNDIPEYSIFKAMREMRSPEMRRGIGFMMVFLKNLSKSNIVSDKN